MLDVSFAHEVSTRVARQIVMVGLAFRLSGSSSQSKRDDIVHPMRVLRERDNNSLLSIADSVGRRKPAKSPREEKYLLI